MKINLLFILQSMPLFIKKKLVDYNIKIQVQNRNL